MWVYCYVCELCAFRFCVVLPSQLSLLSSCLNVFTSLILSEPQQVVSHSLCLLQAPHTIEQARSFPAWMVYKALKRGISLIRFMWSLFMVRAAMVLALLAVTFLSIICLSVFLSVTHVLFTRTWLRYVWVFAVAIPSVCLSSVECSLQRCYLLIYFLRDVNMTSLWPKRK